MIKGIGIDMLEIKRIENPMKISGFRNKCFTNLELKLFENRGIYTAASNFACKEAVSKSLGIGFKIFWPKEIEILRGENGEPYVILHNKAKEFMENRKLNRINVSLTHCKKYVIAISILE